jgi:hypothetical protein
MFQKFLYIRENDALGATGGRPYHSIASTLMRDATVELTWKHYTGLGA